MVRLYSPSGVHLEFDIVLFQQLVEVRHLAITLMDDDGKGAARILSATQAIM